MTTIINRQPAGVPAGGQFSETTHSEPGIDLATPAPAPVGFGLDNEAVSEAFAAALVPALGKEFRGSSAASKPYSPLVETECDEGLRAEGVAATVWVFHPSEEESLAYSVGIRDGRPAVWFAGDSLSVDDKPHFIGEGDLSTAASAAAAAADILIRLDDDVKGSSSRSGTHDGFASDADYHRWRQR